MKNATRIVVKIFQFVLGAACLLGGSIYLTTHTSRFLDVEAEVVSSVEKYYYGDSTLPSYELKCRYQVGGVTYTSSATSSTERAVGEKITMYYNPSDPSELFSSREQKRTQGIAFIVLGLCLVGTLGWKTKKTLATDPGNQAGTSGLQT